MWIYFERKCKSLLPIDLYFWAMALELKLEADDFELAVWHVTEDMSYFEQKLYIHEDEKEIIEELSPRKKLEWYSSRYLLHLMSGRAARGHFIKDMHGKPFLQDSDRSISISHSNNYVAVIASKKTVGIDIQTYVQKIKRIQHKYVRKDEEPFLLNADDIKTLHIIWGAKESLYKAYGKRGLRYLEHLQLKNLDSKSEQGVFTGTIQIDEWKEAYDIFFISNSKYVLVYAKKSV